MLWVGSEGGMERALVERAGIAFRGIETGQLRGQSPLTALRNGGKMLAGLRQSLHILRDFQPDICFVTGGYVCAPVVAACRLRGVPVLIYLPDMKPGWAIRALSKLAQRVAISFPGAAGYFGGFAPEGKAVVTGYPVRQELVELVGNRAAAKRALAEKLGRSGLEPTPPILPSTGSQTGGEGVLDGSEVFVETFSRAAVRGAGRFPVSQSTLPSSSPPSSRPPLSSSSDGKVREGLGEGRVDLDLPLLLIWGGSSGARSINRATWGALSRLLPLAEVLHIVGTRDWALHEEAVAETTLAATLDGPLGARYHPVPYLHDDMALALAAADISVARAGASTLGEFPVAGLPSILVPLAAVNQQENAEALTDHGAALIVEDEALAQQLATTLLSLLADENRLSTMRENLAALAEPDAAKHIARELSKLADR